MDVDTEEHVNVTSPSPSPIVNEKIIQKCPNWVKITEIPHPALVPGFISRRECLPDGSIDPNTQSVSTQINLLCASSLSPSLAGVVGNIPSGMMCEAIYKNNLREVRGDEIEALELKEGYSLSHSLEHYKRTSDPNLINFNNTTTATVNQTTSELSSINILYGGVRGKAYLDSLKTFTQGIDGLKPGSAVENILMERVGKIEAGCGFKIFNIYEINEIQKKCNLEIYNEFMTSAQEIINSSIISDPLSEDSLKIIIDQNNRIIKLLNTCQLFQTTENSEFLSIDSSLRKSLLERLKGNLAKLVERCPEEIKKEKFRGVNVNIQ